MLAAWAAEPSSRGDLKVWALAYWGECPLHKDLGETETEWWRGGAVLLTWQGERGVLPWQPLARGDARELALPLSSLSPTVSRAAADSAAVVDALALQCRSHPQVLCLWEALLKLQTVLTLRFLLQGSAVALEVCPETFLREGKVRAHAHMFLHRSKRWRSRYAAEVLFLLSAPNKSQAQGAFCRARSLSAAAGVYYLRCPKVGSVLSEGSLVPHVDFAAQPAWMWNLLAGGKMRAEAARQEFVRQARDLPRILGCQDKYVQEVAAAALAARMRMVHVDLAAARRPFRRLAVVEAWVELHAKTRWRCPFLVLTGPSCMGKARYALSLVGIGRALELSMACAVEPDLHAYDAGVHELILLDELSAAGVLRQKKLMQAPASMLGLGSSPTNNLRILSGYTRNSWWSARIVGAWSCRSCRLRIVSGWRRMQLLCV